MLYLYSLNPNECMHTQIEFPENVFLIDAAYLNFVISDLKNHFENTLGRSLGQIDIPELMILFALDAGFQKKEGQEALVIWIYDQENEKLAGCIPSDLRKELNGVCFSDQMGEFEFASMSPEGMTSREELYEDMLRILLETQSVRRLVLIGFEEIYKTEIFSDTVRNSGKVIVNFVMDQRSELANVCSETIAYPLMQALGIRGEEL